jgi:hypothetical protein
VSYSATAVEDDVVAARTVVPGARADSSAPPA